MTNPLHHLYYPDFTMEQVSHGIFFYTNVACTYFLVILGVILLYCNVRAERVLAGRLVVASVLVPVALNAVRLTGIVKTSFDITSLGFAISVVLIMLATTKYRFINFRRELAIAGEKLLLEQERNRIAQQVHDTAGHTLTMIQSYMKLAEISVTASEAETAFTPRESDVIRLVAQGYDNREIAGELFLAEGTVRNLVSRLLEKLELKDRTQLAVYAVKHGLDE